MNNKQTIIDRLNLLGSNYKQLNDWAIEIPGINGVSIGNIYLNKSTDFMYKSTISTSDFVFGIIESVTIPGRHLFKADIFIKINSKSIIKSNHFYELTDCFPLTLDGTCTIYPCLLLLRDVSDIDNDEYNNYLIIDSLGNSLRFRLNMEFMTNQAYLVKR